MNTKIYDEIARSRSVTLFELLALSMPACGRYTLHYNVDGTIIGERTFDVYSVHKDGIEHPAFADVDVPTLKALADSEVFSFWSVVEPFSSDDDEIRVEHMHIVITLIS